MTSIIMGLALLLALAVALWLEFWMRDRRLELDEPEIPEFQPAARPPTTRIPSNEIEWEI
jgi:hypothetical protein